jgi:ABC-type transporter Mla MlaB component
MRREIREMTDNGINGQGGKRKAKRETATTPAAADGPRQVLTGLLLSGEWLPAGELRVKALEAAGATTDVDVDLADVDHLDARALQILLALADELRQKGLSLHLVNASPLLCQWFEYAGTPSHLAPTLTRQP